MFVVVELQDVKKALDRGNALKASPLFFHLARYRIIGNKFRREMGPPSHVPFDRYYHRLLA